MGEPGPIVYYGSDDIDGDLAKVREFGGEADEKQPIPGIGWFARCKDSEGNPFSFFQSDETVPPPAACRLPPSRPPARPASRAPFMEPRRGDVGYASAASPLAR